MRILSLESTTQDQIFSSLSSADVHEICDVIKRSLREMNPPIIPFHCYEECIRLAQENVSLIQTENIDPSHQIFEKFQLILSLIDSSKRQLLERLVVHLNQVSLMKDQNKMSSHNLAVVIAPNILRPEVKRLT